MAARRPVWNFGAWTPAGRGGWGGAGKEAPGLSDWLAGPGGPSPPLPTPALRFPPRGIQIENAESLTGAGECT